MQPSSFWQRLIEPYRAGDWDECIRRARRAVDAEPFAPSPRQLLARLYARVDHPRLALLHYEKLLPIAVGRGDLLRALAIQRQIDSLLPPGTQAAGRYEAMQRWFRMVGRSLGIPSDPADAVGFTPATLLSLPPDAFEAMALEMGVDVLDLTPREATTEGGSVRVIVMGRLRWSLALPEQAFGEPAVADEGACVWIDPGQVKRAVLRLDPEVPSECLRFDASLMTKLAGWAPGILSSGHDGAERPAVPAPRPRRPDAPGETPKPASGPPASAPPPRIAAGKAKPTDERLAAALDMMDFSTIDLNGPIKPPGPEDKARIASEPRQFDLSELEPAKAARHGRVVVHHSKHSKRPSEMGDVDGQSLSPVRDPFAAPAESAAHAQAVPPAMQAPAQPAASGESAGSARSAASHTPDRSSAAGKPPAPAKSTPAKPPAPDQSSANARSTPPAESAPRPESSPSADSADRRRHMRVSVALGSRVALVGMRDRSFEANVIDLSVSGLALSLELEAVGGVMRALDGSVVRLELRLPPDGLPHDLAGRVRSVGLATDGQTARVGVEFVMLTEADRAAIRLAIDRVAEGRPPQAA